MEKEVFNGLLAILVGLFSLVCAVKDFEFFMGSRKARFFVNIFGRDGARVFYGLLGVVMMILGLTFMR